MCLVEEHDHEIVGYMIDSHLNDQLVAKIQSILLNELQSSNLNDDSKG